LAKAGGQTVALLLGYQANGESLPYSASKYH